MTTDRRWILDNIPQQGDHQEERDYRNYRRSRHIGHEQTALTPHTPKVPTLPPLEEVLPSIVPVYGQLAEALQEEYNPAKS